MAADVAPVFQLQVDPPLAVKVAVAPIQIADEEELAEMEGNVLTETLVVCVLEQPNALVPVTL